MGVVDGLQLAANEVPLPPMLPPSTGSEPVPYHLLNLQVVRLVQRSALEEDLDLVRSSAASAPGEQRRGRGVRGGQRTRRIDGIAVQWPTAPPAKAVLAAGLIMTTPTVPVHVPQTLSMGVAAHRWRLWGAYRSVNRMIRKVYRAARALGGVGYRSPAIAKDLADFVSQLPAASQYEYFVLRCLAHGWHPMLPPGTVTLQGAEVLAQLRMAANRALVQQAAHEGGSYTGTQGGSTAATGSDTATQGSTSSEGGERPSAAVPEVTEAAAEDLVMPSAADLLSSDDDSVSSDDSADGEALPDDEVGEGGQRVHWPGSAKLRALTQLAVQRIDRSYHASDGEVHVMDTFTAPRAEVKRLMGALPELTVRDGQFIESAFQDGKAPPPADASGGGVGSAAASTSQHGFFAVSQADRWPSALVLRNEFKMHMAASVKPEHSIVTGSAPRTLAQLKGVAKRAFDIAPGTVYLEDPVARSVVALASQEEYDTALRAALLQWQRTTSSAAELRKLMQMLDKAFDLAAAAGDEDVTSRLAALTRLQRLAWRPELHAAIISEALPKVLATLWHFTFGNGNAALWPAAVHAAKIGKGSDMPQAGRSVSIGAPLQMHASKGEQRRVAMTAARVCLPARPVDVSLPRALWGTGPPAEAPASGAAAAHFNKSATAQAGAQQTKPPPGVFVSAAAAACNPAVGAVIVPSILQKCLQIIGILLAFPRNVGPVMAVAEDCVMPASAQEVGGAILPPPDGHDRLFLVQDGGSGKSGRARLDALLAAAEAVDAEDINSPLQDGSKASTAYTDPAKYTDQLQLLQRMLRSRGGSDSSLLGLLAAVRFAAVGCPPTALSARDAAGVDEGVGMVLSSLGADSKGSGLRRPPPPPSLPPVIHTGSSQRIDLRTVQAEQAAMTGTGLGCRFMAESAYAFGLCVAIISTHANVRSMRPLLGSGGSYIPHGNPADPGMTDVESLAAKAGAVGNVTGDATAQVQFVRAAQMQVQGGEGASNSAQRSLLSVVSSAVASKGASCMEPLGGNKAEDITLQAADVPSAVNLDAIDAMVYGAPLDKDADLARGGGGDTSNDKQQPTAAAAAIFTRLPLSPSDKGALAGVKRTLGSPPVADAADTRAELHASMCAQGHGIHSTTSALCARHLALSALANAASRHGRYFAALALQFRQGAGHGLWGGGLAMQLLSWAGSAEERTCVMMLQSVFVAQHGRGVPPSALSISPSHPPSSAAIETVMRRRVPWGERCALVHAPPLKPPSTARPPPYHRSVNTHKSGSVLADHEITQKRLVLPSTAATGASDTHAWTVQGSTTLKRGAGGTLGAGPPPSTLAMSPWAGSTSIAPDQMLVQFPARHRHPLDRTPSLALSLARAEQALLEAGQSAGGSRGAPGAPSKRTGMSGAVMLKSAADVSSTRGVSGHITPPYDHLHVPLRTAGAMRSTSALLPAGWSAHLQHIARLQPEIAFARTLTGNGSLASHGPLLLLHSPLLLRESSADAGDEATGSAEMDAADAALGKEGQALQLGTDRKGTHAAVVTDAVWPGNATQQSWAADSAAILRATHSLPGVMAWCGASHMFEPRSQTHRHVQLTAGAYAVMHKPPQLHTQLLNASLGSVAASAQPGQQPWLPLPWLWAPSGAGHTPVLTWGALSRLGGLKSDSGPHSSWLLLPPVLGEGAVMQQQRGGALLRGHDTAAYALQGAARDSMSTSYLHVPGIDAAAVVAVAGHLSAACRQGADDTALLWSLRAHVRHGVKRAAQQVASAGGRATAAVATGHGHNKTLPSTAALQVSWGDDLAALASWGGSVMGATASTEDILEQYSTSQPKHSLAASDLRGAGGLAGLKSLSGLSTVHSNLGGVQSSTLKLSTLGEGSLPGVVTSHMMLRTIAGVASATWAAAADVAASACEVHSHTVAPSAQLLSNVLHANTQEQLVPQNKSAWHWRWRRLEPRALASSVRDKRGVSGQYTGGTEVRIRNPLADMQFAMGMGDSFEPVLVQRKWYDWWSPGRMALSTDSALVPTGHQAGMLAMQQDVNDMPAWAASPLAASAVQVLHPALAGGAPSAVMDWGAQDCRLAPPVTPMWHQGCAAAMGSWSQRSMLDATSVRAGSDLMAHSVDRARPGNTLPISSNTSLQGSTTAGGDSQHIPAHSNTANRAHCTVSVWPPVLPQFHLPLVVPFFPAPSHLKLLRKVQKHEEQRCEEANINRRGSKQTPWDPEHDTSTALASATSTGFTGTGRTARGSTMDEATGLLLPDDEEHTDLGMDTQAAIAARQRRAREAKFGVQTPWGTLGGSSVAEGGLMDQQGNNIPALRVAHVKTKSAANADDELYPDTPLYKQAQAGKAHGRGPDHTWLDVKLPQPPTEAYHSAELARFKKRTAKRGVGGAESGAYSRIAGGGGFSSSQSGGVVDDTALALAEADAAALMGAVGADGLLSEGASNAHKGGGRSKVTPAAMLQRHRLILQTHWRHVISSANSAVREMWQHAFGTSKLSNLTQLAPPQRHTGWIVRAQQPWAEAKKLVELVWGSSATTARVRADIVARDCAQLLALSTPRTVTGSLSMGGAVQHAGNVWQALEIARACAITALRSGSSRGQDTADDATQSMAAVASSLQQPPLQQGHSTGKVLPAGMLSSGASVSQLSAQQLAQSLSALSQGADQGADSGNGDPLYAAVSTLAQASSASMSFDFVACLWRGVFGVVASLAGLGLQARLPGTPAVVPAGVAGTTTGLWSKSLAATPAQGGQDTWNTPPPLAVLFSEAASWCSNRREADASGGAMGPSADAHASAQYMAWLQHSRGYGGLLPAVMRAIRSAHVTAAGTRTSEVAAGALSALFAACSTLDLSSADQSHAPAWAVGVPFVHDPVVATGLLSAQQELSAAQVAQGWGSSSSGGARGGDPWKLAHTAHLDGMPASARHGRFTNALLMSGAAGALAASCRRAAVLHGALRMRALPMAAAAEITPGQGSWYAQLPEIKSSALLPTLRYCSAAWMHAATCVHGVQHHMPKVEQQGTEAPVQDTAPEYVPSRGTAPPAVIDAGHLATLRLLLRVPDVPTVQYCAIAVWRLASDAHYRRVFGNMGIVREVLGWLAAVRAACMHLLRCLPHVAVNAKMHGSQRWMPQEECRSTVLRWWDMDASRQLQTWLEDNSRLDLLHTATDGATHSQGSRDDPKAYPDTGSWGKYGRAAVHLQCLQAAPAMRVLLLHAVDTGYSTSGGADAALFNASRAVGAAAAQASSFWEPSLSGAPHPAGLQADCTGQEQHPLLLGAASLLQLQQWLLAALWALMYDSGSRRVLTACGGTRVVQACLSPIVPAQASTLQSNAQAEAEDTAGSAAERAGAGNESSAERKQRAQRSQRRQYLYAPGGGGEEGGHSWGRPAGKGGHVSYIAHKGTQATPSRLSGALGVGITALPATLPPLQLRCQHIAVSCLWVLGSDWRTHKHSLRASDCTPDAVRSAAVAAKSAYFPNAVTATRLGLTLHGSLAQPTETQDDGLGPTQRSGSAKQAAEDDRLRRAARKAAAAKVSDGEHSNTLFGYDPRSLPGFLCAAQVPSGLLALADKRSLAPRFLQVYALRALFSLRQLWGKGLGLELATAQPDNKHLMEALLLEYLEFPGQLPLPVPWVPAPSVAPTGQPSSPSLGASARSLTRPTSTSMDPSHSKGQLQPTATADVMLPDVSLSAGYRSAASATVPGARSRMPDIKADAIPRNADAQLRYMAWTSSAGIAGQPLPVHDSLLGGGIASEAQSMSSARDETSLASTHAPPAGLLHHVRNCIRHAAWLTEVHTQRHITSMLAVLSMRPSYRVGFVAGGGVPKVMGVLQMWRDKELAYQRRLRSALTEHRIRWGAAAADMPLSASAHEALGSGQDHTTVLQLMATLVNISVNSDAQALIGEGNVRMLMEMANPASHQYVHPALQSLASKALVNLSKHTANRTFLYRAELAHKTHGHRSDILAASAAEGLPGAAQAAEDDQEDVRSMGSVEEAVTPPWLQVGMHDVYGKDAGQQPPPHLASAGNWRIYGAQFSHSHAASRLTGEVAGMIHALPEGAGDPSLLARIDPEAGSGIALADEEVLLALAHPRVTKPVAVAHAVEGAILGPQPPRQPAAAYVALRGLFSAAFGESDSLKGMQGGSGTIANAHNDSKGASKQLSSKNTSGAQMSALASQAVALQDLSAADLVAQGRYPGGALDPGLPPHKPRPPAADTSSGMALQLSASMRTDSGGMFISGHAPADGSASSPEEGSFAPSPPIRASASAPRERSQAMADRMLFLQDVAHRWDAAHTSPLTSRLSTMMVNRKAIVENDSVSFAAQYSRLQNTTGATGTARSAFLPPRSPLRQSKGSKGGYDTNETLMLRTTRNRSAEHRTQGTAGWSSGAISVREYVLDMPASSRPGWGGGISNMSMQRIILPHQMDEEQQANETKADSRKLSGGLGPADSSSSSLLSSVASGSRAPREFSKEHIRADLAGLQGSASYASSAQAPNGSSTTNTARLQQQQQEKRRSALRHEYKARAASLSAVLAGDDASVDSDEELQWIEHQTAAAAARSGSRRDLHTQYGQGEVPSVLHGKKASSLAPHKAAARLWMAVQGGGRRTSGGPSQAPGATYVAALNEDDAGREAPMYLATGAHLGEDFSNALTDDPEEAALQRYLAMKPGLGVGLGQSIPEYADAMAYFTAEESEQQVYTGALQARHEALLQGAGADDVRQAQGRSAEDSPRPPSGRSPMRSTGSPTRGGRRVRPASAGGNRTVRNGVSHGLHSQALSDERNLNFAYTARERWSPMITGAIVRDQLGRKLASASTKTYVVAAVDSGGGRPARPASAGPTATRRRDPHQFDYVRVTVDSDAVGSGSGSHALRSNPQSGPSAVDSDGSQVLAASLRSTRVRPGSAGSHRDTRGDTTAGRGASRPRAEEDARARMLLATVYDNADLTFYDAKTEASASAEASQRLHSSMVQQMLRLQMEGKSTLLAGTVPGGMGANKFAVSAHAAALGSTASTVENATLHAKRSALASGQVEGLMRHTQGTSKVHRAYQPPPAELTDPGAPLDDGPSGLTPWHNAHQVTVDLARPGFSQKFTFGRQQPGLSSLSAAEEDALGLVDSDDDVENKDLPGENSRRMGRLFAWKSKGGGVSKGLFPSHTLPDGTAVHYTLETDIHTALYTDSGPPPDPPCTLFAIMQQGYPWVPAPPAPCAASNRFLPGDGAGLDDEEADGSLEAAGDFPALATSRMAGTLDLARRGGVWGNRPWTSGMAPGQRPATRCRLRLLVDPVPKASELPEEGPQVEVIQRQVESVFAERTWASEHKDYFLQPRVMKRAFDYDWQRIEARGQLARFTELHLKRASTTRSTKQELYEIRSILQREYEYLSLVYDFFCAIDSAHEGFTMQWGAFSAFFKNVGLMDNAMDGFKVSDLDTIFIQLCVGAKQSQGTVAQVKDKELNRWQFLEAITRIAHGLYVRAAAAGAPLSWPAALERFIARDVRANLHPFFEECQDDYRSARVYNLDVNDSLTRHLPMLQRLFQMYCDPTVTATEVVDPTTKRVAQRTLMSTAGWTGMLRAAELLDDNYTRRDALLAFTWSRMRTASDWDEAAPSTRLTWPDFLEAICRTADTMSLPTAQDVKLEGVDSPYEYVQKMAQEQRPLKRRASGQWYAPKTRPLAEKLDAFLDILYHSLRRSIENKHSPRAGGDDGVALSSTLPQARSMRAADSGSPRPDSETAWQVAQRVAQGTVHDDAFDEGVVPIFSPEHNDAFGLGSPMPSLGEAASPLRPASAGHSRQHSSMFSPGSAAAASPVLSHTVRLAEHTQANSLLDPGAARATFSDAQSTKLSVNASGAQRAGRGMR